MTLRGRPPATIERLTRSDAIVSVNIICDFDGTISTEDVTDGILSRFASSKWLEIETAWKAGLIGSRECMRNQMALVEASRVDIDRYLDSVAIDPYFPAFVEYCADNSIELCVVSDGIDYAIRRIVCRHRLDLLPVVANKLNFLDGDHYALEFPYATRACASTAGTCKCDVARQISNGMADDNRTLLIGDGASDFCAARRADFTFAKDSLLTHCRTHGLPHIEFTDFDHARLLLIDFIDAPFIPLEATQI